MAHFAKLNENNIVTEVIVVHNHEIIDENLVEQEQKGIDFCVNLFGGTWKQTSYNTRGGVHYANDGVTPDNGVSLRKNYAMVGASYDPIKDAFIPTQPFPSWILNEETCLWEPPVPMPKDEKIYAWDEEVKAWVETEPVAQTEPTAPTA